MFCPCFLFTKFCMWFWIHVYWKLKHTFSPVLNIRFGLFIRLSGSSWGSSEAQMPEIKINIIQLKWSFSRVIIVIKACLLQNFSLLPFLVLEIWRRKINSQEGNKSCINGKCIYVFGRQGLEGPQRKAMLLWLGVFLCNWLAGYLAIWVYFYVSS